MAGAVQAEYVGMIGETGMDTARDRCRPGARDCAHYTGGDPR